MTGSDSTIDGGRSAAMKPDRRAFITTQAALLFDEQGYSQTTMQDIAELVGLKKPTLYHYVTSKDEILFLIHDEFVELLFSRQRHRMDFDLTYDERLRETMRDILRLMASHRSHVRVFFEHHRELSEPYRLMIKSKRDEYFKIVVGYIEAGMNDGRYKIRSAELAALALFGMCNWACTWFRDDGAFSADEIAENFWSWLTSGIAPGVMPLTSEMSGGG